MEQQLDTRSPALPVPGETPATGRRRRPRMMHRMLLLVAALLAGIGVQAVIPSAAHASTCSIWAGG